MEKKHYAAAGRIAGIVLLIALLLISPVSAVTKTVTTTGSSNPVQVVVTQNESRQVPVTVIPGDSNRDGRFSSLDALMALQMSTGEIPVDLNADINGDGQVSSLDAAQILQMSTAVIPVLISAKNAAKAQGIERTLTAQPTTSGVNATPAMVKNIPTTSIGGNPQTVPLTAVCLTGSTRCHDTCKDLLSDPSNCGTCDRACLPGYGCTAGACTLQCSAGLTACNGVCVNLLADSSNCAACGNVCSVGSCENGQCVARMATTRPGDAGRIHL